uniref:Uncharacterized protein n=1 Tax=Setaria italica TaxID=4555 RepID=K3YZI7_SETIT
MRWRLSCCCRRPVAGDDNSDEDEEDDRGEEALSAVGLVDTRHMRMSIKAFFDQYIDVEHDDVDDEIHTDFGADFMSATGFVNRLWDLRWVIEVFLDGELDRETHRATMAKRLGDLEEVLNARTRDVSMGRIKIVQ